MEEGTLAQVAGQGGGQGLVRRGDRRDRDRQGDDGVRGGRRGHHRQDRRARGHRGREGQRPDRRPARGGRERRRDRRRAGAGGSRRRSAGRARAALRPRRRAPAPAAAAARAEAGGGRVFASPLARRIAAEKGLDLAAIKGSGPNGRIVKADVEAAQPRRRAAACRGAGGAPRPRRPPPAPDAEAVKKLYADREFEEIKLDGMRKTIAARLTEAKQTIPHFYLRRDIRLDALLALPGAAQQASSRRAA